MKVQQFKPESVIFPDCDICIILSGLVETKVHSFGSRIPKTHASLIEGDILGYMEGDNGRTTHVETWSISKSHTEVIWMSRDDFADLWQI